MAKVWVYWDGVPKVFSSAQAAMAWRAEYPQDGDGHIFEATVDEDRLSIFQEWELESEKTYRAIGRFMYEFSQIEYAVKDMVCNELHVPAEHFTAVSSTFDVAVLCTLAITVFASRENADEIKSLVNRFRELNNHRQRVAHGLWVPFIEGGSVLFTARSSLKGASHQKQQDALEKLADDALSLRNNLSEAVNDVGIFFQDDEY